MKKITALFLAGALALCASCKTVPEGDLAEETTAEAPAVTSGTAVTDPEASPASFQDVLEGKAKFIFMGEAVNIKDFNFMSADGGYNEISRYTVLDLDRNGDDEMLLQIISAAGDEGCWLVLRRESDGVYGFRFNHRLFWELKADGTFIYSSEAGTEDGVASLIFEDGSYIVCPRLSAKGEAFEFNEFTIDGNTVSEEEFRVALDEQAQKPEAEWTWMNGAGGVEVNFEETTAAETEVPQFTTVTEASETVAAAVPPITSLVPGEPVTSIIDTVPETAEPSHTADRIKAVCSTNQSVYGEYGDIEVTVRNVGEEDFVVNFIELENDKGESKIYQSPYVILGKNKSHTVTIPRDMYYFNRGIVSGKYNLKCRLVAMDLKDYRDFVLPVEIDLGDARSLEITHSKPDGKYAGEDVAFTIENVSDKKLTLLEDAFRLYTYDYNSEAGRDYTFFKSYFCTDGRELLPGGTLKITLPCEDMLSGNKFSRCQLRICFVNERGDSFSDFTEFEVRAEGYGEDITYGE